jgi:peptidoglycan/LPS O-acetylase OafA/YrhL
MLKALSAASAGAPAARTRFYALDGVRAAAMLLGISFHSLISFMPTLPASWPAPDIRRSIGLAVFAGWLHSFRMPLFFLVAGFFGHMLYHRLGGRAFFRNRVRRILVPFVLGLLLLTPIVHVIVVYGNLKTGFISDPRGLGSAIVHHFRSGEFFRSLDTLHLWFLYYLMVIYVGTLIARVLFQRIGSATAERWFDGAFRTLVKAWWKPVVLAVPTALVFSLMQTASFDTPVSLVPQARIVLGYGLFFAFGWILHRQPELIFELRRGAWKLLLLGNFVAFPALMGFSFLLLKGAGAPVWAKPAAALAHAFVTWLMVLGTLGIAVRYLQRPNKVVRYVADSSYWLYLIHPPLVLWLQIQLAPVALPAVIKFLVIQLAVLPPLLLSYHYFIRYTSLGEVLTGARQRRAAQTSA